MDKTHVKIGDEVVIIAGADKGKAGVVKTLDRKKMRVTIEGEGIKTGRKAVKPTQNSEGGLVDFDRPIDISNVMKKDKYEARKAKA